MVAIPGKLALVVPAAAAESVDVVAMQLVERTGMVERVGMRALPATVEVA